MPAHPHCLCHLALVYPSEIEGKTAKDRIKAGGDEWLEKKSHAERCEVLGIKGANTWEKGGDWRRYMRGWSTDKMMRRLAVRSKDGKINAIISLDKALEFLVDGTKRFIPKKTVITPHQIIAGKGNERTLRIASKLESEFGGNAEGWQKMVGTIQSSQFLFDIHWYYHEQVGNVKFKIKSLKRREEK